MNREPELPETPKATPHRRGFRARVHAQSESGESGFSQRALAASAILHVALLGSVGFTSIAGGSVEAGGRVQTVAFARAGELAWELDRLARSEHEQVPEQIPERSELMRELWESELREAPEEIAEPNAPKFNLPTPTRDDWPRVSAVLGRAVEPSDEEPLPEQSLQEDALELVPLLLSAPPPPYPALARRMSWEGTVHCLIEVAIDGTVTRVSVACSSGHEILDEAAQRALREWRFESGAGERKLTHKVTFRLSNSTS